jgi:hypothetical protein
MNLQISIICKSANENVGIADLVDSRKESN